MNISVEEEQEKHLSLTCYINLYVTEIFLYKKVTYGNGVTNQRGIINELSVV